MRVLNVTRIAHDFGGEVWAAQHREVLRPEHDVVFVAREESPCGQRHEKD